MKTALESFQRALTGGGWAPQAISDAATVRANLILVASRYPITVTKLPAPTVDELLTTNALCVDAHPAFADFTAFAHGRCERR